MSTFDSEDYATKKAEVYISIRLLGKGLMETCSVAMSLTVLYGNYSFGLSNICQAIYRSTHLQIQIRILDNMFFLVFFSFVISICQLI
jgi:hypothetical protein